MLTDGGADGVRHQRFRTCSISAFVEARAIFQKMQIIFPKLEDWK